jgi:hypothetical protein
MRARFEILRLFATGAAAVEVRLELDDGVVSAGNNSEA